jgi:hypothetical protein
LFADTALAVVVNCVKFPLNFSRGAADNQKSKDEKGKLAEMRGRKAMDLTLCSIAQSAPLRDNAG